MSDEYAARLAALEQLDEDMFDFPDVEQMADLIAASRSVAARAATSPKSPASASGRAAGAVAAEGEPKAPLPAPKSSAPKTAIRSNAPPRNADDLDEDLFGFGELHDLRTQRDDDAPEYGPGSSLLEVSPGANRQENAQSPKAARKEPAAALPASQAEAEPAQDKARAPKRKKSDAEPRPAARDTATADTTSSASPTPSARTRAAVQSAPMKRESVYDAIGSNSPFLSLPSIDLPPARSKLLWVLVGCFLLANAGVFLTTQQQNQNVNQTLLAVASQLAEAVAHSANAAPREAPLYREAALDRDPRASDVDPAGAVAPMIDPADFSNTNELGLHNARRLIEQGAYAEARRNLFFILSNQDRSTPLTPALREDIDYLIALTYYDQGRSIAVEEKK